MRMLMTVALIAMAAPVTAQPALTGQRAHIAQVLPFHGYRDVDVRRLRNSQVAQIAFLAHSNKSHGEVKGQIGAVLRGGLLQRTIERVLR